jgi:hypothetical protein
MVQWWNTKKLDNSKTAAWCPSWYAPTAKHGEVASATGDVPTWEIIQHEDVVTVFEFDEMVKRNKDGGLALPASVRKYFLWLSETKHYMGCTRARSWPIE